MKHREEDMASDRRDNCRVPDSRLITEIVTENPFAASIVNISNTGMFTVKPVSCGLRGPRILQLEIPVPEANESIWATGEIMFETKSLDSVGSGIHFLNMARGHRALIGDLVEHRRKEILASMLREIQWRKELAAYPSPYMAPPPPVREDTVRMYLMPDLD
jgi:hypothetical protein